MAIIFHNIPSTRSVGSSASEKPTNLVLKEPVLVVHGIATRNEDEFFRDIASFNQAVGENWKFIPTFWGHEGAKGDYTVDIMPNHGIHGLEHLDDIDIFEQFGKEIAEKICQIPRMYVLDKVLPFIGDVILYQGSRNRIHQEIRNYIPTGYGTKDKPISIIAHSLGGVICFDMAVSNKDQLWIKHFITLGSQSSFFHIHSPRSEMIKDFHGNTVKLPPSIQSWTNIWDRNDWLAFAASGVFTLHNGKHPTEHPVQQFDSFIDAPFKSHTGYWACGEVIKKVRQVLTL